MRLSELRAALAASGQRLSLDPPGDPTIGALLARNVSGPLRHRFGAPRDLVLGATLVLADGTIANAGGKVVKNVAGYDLARLVCGSRGTPRLHRTRQLPAPSAAESGAHTGRRDRRLPRTSLRDSSARSSSRARSTSSIPVASPSSSRDPSAPSRRSSRPRRALVGGEESDASVWDESRDRQGAARGRVRFAPGELESTLASLGQAIVRPAAGIAYTRERDASYRRLHAEIVGHDLLVDRIEHELDPRGPCRDARCETPCNSRYKALGRSWGRS